MQIVLLNRITSINCILQTTNPMECTPAKLKCRAIAHAEKLVGFPTSVFHLQSLMTDDVTSMTSHLRKLMTSDHPILKTVKRLIHFEGKTDAQVRGLIVLLLSRATATEQVRILYISDPIFQTIHYFCLLCRCQDRVITTARLVFLAISAT